MSDSSPLGATSQGGTQGSTAASTPQGGNPVSAPPAENAGQGRPAWISQLPGDLQNHEAFTKYQKLGDFGKAHLEAVSRAKELEERLGRAVVLPAQDAKPEEYQAFLERLGVPKDESGYDFSGVQIEGWTPQAETEASFRAMAKKAALTPSQARALYAEMAAQGLQAEQKVQAAIKAQEEAKKARAIEAKVTLQREWGTEYDRNTEIFKRFAQDVFKDNPEFAKAVIEDESIGNNPAFIKAMHKIALRMRNDEILGIGKTASGRTPGVIDYPSMRNL